MSSLNGIVKLREHQLEDLKISSEVYPDPSTSTDYDLSFLKELREIIYTLDQGHFHLDFFFYVNLPSYKVTTVFNFDLKYENVLFNEVGSNGFVYLKRMTIALKMPTYSNTPDQLLALRMAYDLASDIPKSTFVDFVDFQEKVILVITKFNINKGSGSNGLGIYDLTLHNKRSYSTHEHKSYNTKRFYSTDEVPLSGGARANKNYLYFKAETSLSLINKLNIKRKEPKVLLNLGICLNKSRFFSTLYNDGSSFKEFSDADEEKLDILNYIKGKIGIYM